ncbi:MAG: hypothetical protein J6N47_01960 [Lachnospiraceae bacterium]|nr:hypothetical protein [Lachnospiraceae bacterium]
MSSMLNYLQLNITTLINYAGTGFLLILYALSYVYLFIAEKDDRKRTFFIWIPTVLWLVFMLPPVRWLFIKLIDSGDTYYRMLWMIPISATTAHAVAKLSSRYRLIGLAAVSAVIVLCGSSVYNAKAGEVNIVSAAQNPYHIPDEAIDVVELVKKTDEGHKIRAVMPEEMTFYVRQYDTDVYLAFGREMVMGFPVANGMYEVMSATPVDVWELIRKGRERLVSAYVFGKYQVLSDDPEEYGLIKLGETENYKVYYDPEELEYVQSISYFYFK